MPIVRDFFRESIVRLLALTIALTAVLLLFGACAQVGDGVEAARTYSAKGAAGMVVAECTLSTTQRRKNAAAVNDELRRNDSPATFLLDCDGDGNADW